MILLVSARSLPLRWIPQSAAPPRRRHTDRDYLLLLAAAVVVDARGVSASGRFGSSVELTRGTRKRRSLMLSRLLHSAGS